GPGLGSGATELSPKRRPPSPVRHLRDDPATGRDRRGSPVRRDLRTLAAPPRDVTGSGRGPGRLQDAVATGLSAGPAITPARAQHLSHFAWVRPLFTPEPDPGRGLGWHTGRTCWWWERDRSAA